MQNVRRAAYLLALIVSGALITAMVWNPAPPAKFVGLAPADVPATLGNWRSGGDYEMTPEVKAALASASLVARTYTDGAQPIDFVMIGGTDRSALHDPRSCLVGGGWRLVNDRPESLPGTDLVLRSCQAVGGPDGAAFDMLYVYVVDGRTVNQVTEIRGQMLLSAVLGKKNTPVHFLRFMLPIGPDGTVSPEEHARAQDLARRVWQSIGPRLTAMRG